MTAFDRRSFLAAAGLGIAAVALGGCSTAPGGTAGGPGGRGLRWWDQFAPQAELEKQIFAEFAQSGGIPVEYTTYNPNEQGQALQLAFSSKQMPDVFTLAGVQIPPARLVTEGWFAPIPLSEQDKARMPQGALLDGFTVFDGQVYAIPLRTFRQYDTLTWYNAELMQKAGVDPDRDLATYDGFRRAARAAADAGGDGVSGWIAPLQFTDRMEAHLVQLALASGVPAVANVGGVVDPATGAYAFDHPAFAQALEFLLSMQRDGLLFPASSSLDARGARARWSTGTSGLFFDGSYNIGVITKDFEAFAGKVGVASIPTPDGGPVRIHQAPPSSAQAFWLSSQSQAQDQASALLARFTSEDVSIRLAEAMDAMPADLSAVDKAEVHPTYRKAAALFREQVFLAPSAIVANPAVADVEAEMKPIEPDLGTIVQGAFTGQVADPTAALREYNTKLTAERDRAIGVVAGTGATVGVADWATPDWTPGQDYTPDRYGS